MQLHNADFITAARIVAAINKTLAAGAAPIAEAKNSGLIEVRIPDAYRARSVEFIAAIEGIQVETDRSARIVVNEKTGTVVLGNDVRIAPVSILHGNLTVEVETSYSVSQPAPFSGPGAQQSSCRR